MKFGYTMKHTTPVHWLYGAACVYLIYQFGLLWGWIAMGAFAGLEKWNDQEEFITKPDLQPRGCTDFWESFIIFFPGNCVLALLNHLAIVSIVLSV